MGACFACDLFAGFVQAISERACCLSNVCDTTAKDRQMPIAAQHSTESVCGKPPSSISVIEPLRRYQARYDSNAKDVRYAIVA